MKDEYFWRFASFDANYATALVGEHDHVLLTLSLFVACLAVYAALAVVNRIRVAKTAGAKRWWLIVGTIAMGCGIWAMHFTAMLALSLPVPVSYSPSIILMAFVPASLASGAALYAMSPSSFQWWRLQLGGILMASGIATMHYTGMEAIEFSGTLTYDLVLFCLSVVVAYLLATASLYLHFVLDKVDATYKRWSSLFSSVVMGSAVFAMHHTAMAAAMFHSDFTLEALNLGSSSLALGVAIFLVVSAIAGVAVICTLIDQRLTDSAESLRQSEAWANAIVNTSADGILSTDSSGTVLSFNKSAERMFGYPASEVIGTNVQILTPTRHHEIHDEFLSRFLTTNGVQTLGRYREINAKRKDDSTFPMEIGVTEFRWGESHIFIGSVRDLTARKAGNDALIAHARQQAAVAQLGQRAVLENDLDVLYKLATEQLVKILDADYSEVLELNPDGQSFFLRAGAGWDSGLVGEALFGVEIDSQAGYALSCKTPVVVKDLASGTRFRRSALLESHGVVSGLNVKISAEAGPIGVLGVHCHTPRTFTEDDENFLRSVANVLSQVVDRVRSQDERNLIRAQLGQEQKLTSIGELAAGIAHEINTPTQYVGDNIHFIKDAFNEFFALQKCYAELLQAARTDSVTPALIGDIEAALQDMDWEYVAGEVPNAIAQSLDGVQRIAKIVLAMKEFSHPGGEGRKFANLNHSIENTITVASNEWKYLAEMSTELDENLPLVPCFPAELGQVILNLIVNAAHAIGDVVGDDSHAKGTITISTLQVQRQVEIRISDTGNGIPDSVREKVFDPFFTTKEVGKGTGQGLAIARSVVVDKHGGTLRLETTQGQGTTFIVSLPLDVAGDQTQEAAA
jgi:PAS domain S-box-containing protein